MTKAPVPATVDEYIAGFEPTVRAVLRKVRAAVRRGAPEAEEVISYGMPAVRGRGILVYYAAFQGHIGLYPPIKGDAALEKAAARYANEKGNLRFPFSEPIPYELIERLARLRAEQDGSGAPSKRKTGANSPKRTKPKRGSTAPSARTSTSRRSSSRRRS
jgi:uncharacterized protein YdhG (YjbR/CyaY superfamily)